MYITKKYDIYIVRQKVQSVGITRDLTDFIWMRDKTF